MAGAPAERTRSRVAREKCRPGPQGTPRNPAAEAAPRAPDCAAGRDGDAAASLPRSSSPSPPAIPTSFLRRRPTPQPRSAGAGGIFLRFPRVEIREGGSGDFLALFWKTSTKLGILSLCPCLVVL